MKPSTELFDLIKSLSKSEKRFFKLSSSLQTGDKNYLKIFDAIDKQKTYDEEALKDQFRDETFVKHFPSEKNHLYKLILKSLRSYHSDSSISSILKQELKNVEILYKKALYKECNKFLARAKKLARDHEKFYFLYECITWEKQLLEQAYESGKFDKDLDALVHEEEHVIAQLRNLAEYHVLYSKINYVFRRNGFARNERQKATVTEVADHPLIKGKNTALSSRAATICYYVQGLCHVTNREHDLAFKKFQRVQEIMDDNPKIKADIANRYVRTLSHLLFSYLDNNDFDRCLEMIDEMRALPKQNGFDSEDVKVQIFTSTYTAELVVRDRLGDYENAIALADDIEKNLEAFGQKVNKEQEIVFYYNIANVYFGAGNYRNSLKWINLLLNDNEQQLRQDIYIFARIMNLIIHFELGNTDLLEYLLKSTTRYLNKRKKDYEAESVILKYLKKLPKLVYEDDLVGHFESMRTDLNKLFKEHRERVVLDYFDFNAWLDSKIDGVTFAEAAKRHRKKEYPKAIT